MTYHQNLGPDNDEMEEEKIDKEGRIRKFMRYMDDSTEKWVGKEEELKKKLKDIEDKKKGIQLELDIEEEGRIMFLDIEIRRM